MRQSGLNVIREFLGRLGELTDVYAQVVAVDVLDNGNQHQ